MSDADFDTEEPNKMTRRSFIKKSTVLGVGAVVAFKLLEMDDKVIDAFGPATRQIIQDEWLPTACWIGKQDCGMNVHIMDGRIVKFEGIERNPRNKGRLCVKGMAQVMSVYDPYRVKAPLKRTNAKGEPGQWKEIGWDEALTELATRIKNLDNPHKFVWQVGRSKASPFYDQAFVNASGALKLHNGAQGSDAGNRACEYTIGMHGVLHPDFRKCNYLLNWGWNLRNAGGNKFCWITWTREMINARERGMKLVTLDPNSNNSNPFNDEFYGIRPGTDLMFFLAIANLLVKKGYVDSDYLIKYTNSPFLVKNDGRFLRDSNGKEMVWDNLSFSARAFDDVGVSPALDGNYTVNGEDVSTSYELFTAHVAQYTSTAASEVTGLKAEDIEHIADELGSNAMIGSTIMVDGISMPYRPVGIAASHVAQQEMGFQAVRAAVQVYMLLGAIYTPGGLRIDLKPTLSDNFDMMEEMSVDDPPYNLYLANSKFYPINSNNTSLIAHALKDPGKYGIDVIPEVMVIHMTNLLTSFADQEAIGNFLGRLQYIAVIDPWMSETADHYADLVLPAATIEKYEGPLSASDQYEDAVSLRIAIIDPLYQSRGEIDIYLDLCDKAGFLYGSGGYIDHINQSLELSDTYKLDLTTKPEVVEILDRWAKDRGFEEGIKYFKAKGVSEPKTIPVEELYPYAQSHPFEGKLHRLYGEGLKRLGDEMKEKGADKIYWQDYTAFPTWRPLTMDSSPEEYDLYLISSKLITYKQQRTTFNPLLNELEPHQVLEMNPETAHEKGLHEGEEVIIESHNAITGETREVKAQLAFGKGLRPDTVNLLHHFGNWVNPKAKNKGTSANTLFFTGEGYVTNTADQAFHVKVNVRGA